MKTEKFKQAARRKVYKAIKAGILIKPETCPKCGSDKLIQGHHEDYERPLDVTWLCYQCHKQLHVERGNWRRLYKKVALYEIYEEAVIISKRELENV